MTIQQLQSKIEQLENIIKEKKLDEENIVICRSKNIINKKTIEKYLHKQAEPKLLLNKTSRDLEDDIIKLTNILMNLQKKYYDYLKTNFKKYLE